MALLIAVLLSLAAATASHAQQDRDLQGYTLVFSDEFDGPLSLGSHRDEGSAKWADGPPYGPASSVQFLALGSSGSEKNCVDHQQRNLEPPDDLLSGD
jgi:hypothetical protein